MVATGGVCALDEKHSYCHYSPLMTKFFPIFICNQHVPACTVLLSDQTWYGKHTWKGPCGITINGNHNNPEVKHLWVKGRDLPKLGLDLNGAPCMLS